MLKLTSLPASKQLWMSSSAGRICWTTMHHFTPKMWCHLDKTICCSLAHQDSIETVYCDWFGMGLFGGFQIGPAQWLMWHWQPPFEPSSWPTSLPSQQPLNFVVSATIPWHIARHLLKVLSPLNESRSPSLPKRMVLYPGGDLTLCSQYWPISLLY
jgi:hypothetical protein